ncbi:MAG: YfiR family protein [Janthinobacterium lividum]
MRQHADACERSFRFTGCRPLLLLTVAVFGLVSADAQTTAVSEDDLRAAMVQHLTSFVDWPPAKLDATHLQFTVCLLGADPIRSALEAAFRNHTVSSKPVVVQRLSTTDKVDGCHVLYVGGAGRKDLLRLLPALQQASVLTVSERGDAQGQVIGLPADDDHVVIQVDLHAAQASRLVISSRLLHLATLVNKQ